jgi:putative transposase
VLRVRHVDRTDTPHVQAILHTVFRERGLPTTIRTDNGPPFASHAPGGLSRLAMGWIRLGIHHERIAPGCPEQNGRHERMHLTLLQDTAKPPAAHRAAQQERFARFEQCFNFERPHEALDNKTPGSIYVSSPRLLSSRLAEIHYPDDYLVRRVQQHGDIKVDGQRTFLSEILAREWIGLRLTDGDIHEVYWSSVLLGWYDSRSHTFVPLKRPRRRRDWNS